MAEENKRLVEGRQERIGKCLHQRCEAPIRHFSKTTLTTGKLDRANLHIAREVVWPGPENRRAATGIWKTEQTQAGLRIRTTVNQPGIQFLTYLHVLLPPSLCAG